MRKLLTIERLENTLYQAQDDLYECEIHSPEGEESERCLARITTVEALKLCLENAKEAERRGKLSAAIQAMTPKA